MLLKEFCLRLLLALLRLRKGIMTLLTLQVEAQEVLRRYLRKQQQIRLIHRVDRVTAMRHLRTVAPLEDHLMGVALVEDLVDLEMELQVVALQVEEEVDRLMVEDLRHRRHRRRLDQMEMLGSLIRMPIGL